MTGHMSVRLGPCSLPVGYRVALVVPLAFGVYIALWDGFGWRLGDPGWSFSSFLVAAAFWLVPCVLYVAAAVLVLRARPQRRLWLVLLACTVAVCAILAIAYLSMGVRFDGAPALISYLLEPLFVPLYLIVLAVVHLFDSSLDRG
jgi:hypothetical protein